MRVALLSAVQYAPSGELRAIQELAGRSVLAWQVDLAVELGCERFICLCETPLTEVIAQQRRIEALGFAFHAVRTQLQFSSLIRSEGSIFIQQDGLVIGDGALDFIREDLSEADAGIFALEADHSLCLANQEDFERIDRDRNWAGIALLPGETVNAFADMPGDSDTISLLLRLGLQSRVSCKIVPAPMLEDDTWLLASDEEGLRRRCDAITQASLAVPDWTGPSHALAATIVRASAPKWLGAGSEVFAGVAVVAMLVGGGIAAFGMAGLGLGIAAFGAFLAGLSGSARRLREGISREDHPAGLLGRILQPLSLVITLLAAIVLALAHTQASEWTIQFALPILTLGLAHLASVARSRRVSAFWHDTPLHLAIFTIAAFFGILQEALLVFALGALLQMMLRSLDHSAIAAS